MKYCDHEILKRLLFVHDFPKGHEVQAGDKIFDEIYHCVRCDKEIARGRELIE